MTSEIDPETIRSSLRDFAQKLKDLERERDEAIAKLGVMQRQAGDLENDRNECEERINTLQKTLEDTEQGMRDSGFWKDLFCRYPNRLKWSKFGAIDAKC